ncbi:MAG TPA: mercury resistance system periplasmic binding protein MerP, partial [Thiolapillus brandeum]|nr:mercury resistance system periplasmic binding protein MerP [Thiolapillus brandeum]
SKTVTLDVPGMTCKFCPITIRKALGKAPGVIEATADFETKSATVVYDPDKTSVTELTKATANAGYPSTVKKTD